MDDVVQIGRYTCHAYFNMPYNMYELATRGPYIHKRGRMILRCVVSAELIEGSTLDWHPLLARQFDREIAALWRTAPIMQRKIRRMVRS